MEGLKNTVQAMLEQGTDIPVCYQRADKNTLYPYFVYEYRRLSDDSGIERYVLEVNGWDQNQTSSRIEKKMDELERAIHTLKISNEDRVVVIYKGLRNPVDDEDKSIRRCRQQFEMQVCERR